MSNVTNIVFVTANCRSVENKLPSLYDFFDNTDCAAALLTETWIKTSTNLENIYDDITKTRGLDIIYYNRPGKRKGGGVAIVFDKAKVNLEEHKFRRDGIEIVAAKGRISGQKRKLFLFCI